MKRAAFQPRSPCAWAGDSTRCRHQHLARRAHRDTHTRLDRHGTGLRDRQDENAHRGRAGCLDIEIIEVIEEDEALALSAVVESDSEHERFRGDQGPWYTGDCGWRYLHDGGPNCSSNSEPSQLPTSWTRLTATSAVRQSLAGDSVVLSELHVVAIREHALGMDGRFGRRMRGQCWKAVFERLI